MTPDQIARASSAIATRTWLETGHNAFWNALGILASCILENDMELNPERLYKAAARMANRRLADFRSTITNPGT